MITFSRVTQLEDEATGAVTPTVTTVTGSAIQVRSDPERLKALGLTLTIAITLLFTPTTYGLRAQTADFVQPLDTVEWNGQTYTVKDVEPVAPDGIVIVARVVVIA
jgi:hypothetical protein